MKRAWLPGLAVFFLARASAAASPTIAGQVTLPHPTLENLSVEWEIQGDDDLDGVVSVRVRESGGAFRDAFPLTRVPAGSNAGHAWTNRHAGSVFGLSPDTEYEIELTLVDPDGGGETRFVNARTRKVPAAQPGAPVTAVTPATLKTALAAAKPGSVLLLGAGTYAGFTATVSGTASAPVVLRGESAASVIIDGDVRLDGLSHVYLESVTVQGKIKLNDGTDIAVKGCTVQAKDFGIVAYGGGSTDGYFADNVITGTTTWEETSLGVSGNNLGEGIQLTGPGNVMEHNRVRGFRDCLSLLEADEAVDQRSIDIHDNELADCADDGIEADYAMGNVRVYGNRLTATFMGISSQPSLGGPTYLVRNAMYGTILEPFKLHNGSTGNLIVHNTVVKNGDGLAVYSGAPISRSWFRNNLVLGGTGGGTFNGFDTGTGRLVEMVDCDGTCDLDYDGLGSVGTGLASGHVGNIKFTSFAELTSLTTEKHATQLGIEALGATSFPTSPFPEPAPQDLRLSAGSAALDKGVVLAGLNDGYAGAAPDLGAYEGTDALPAYGPRDGGAGAAGSGGGGGASGGSAGTGGASGGSAGAAGKGGSAGGAGSAGGSAGASGAAGAGGGSGGAAGSAGKGGISGSAGAATAGAAGAKAGAAGTTGSSGKGGSAAGSASADPTPMEEGDVGGCGCHVTPQAPSYGFLSLAGLALALLRRRRPRS